MEDKTMENGMTEDRVLEPGALKDRVPAGRALENEALAARTPKDGTFEGQIRAAFDSMAPTPDQENRMLAALLEAQQQKAAETAGPAKKHGSFNAWKIVAPIAACLVMGAIVIGVGSMGNDTAASIAQSKDAQSAASLTSANQTTADSSVTMMATEAEVGVAADSYYGGEPAVVVDPSGAFNTEEYAAVDENGFVATRTQPLSTVSADVDTASYANLRRMVNDGYGLDDIPAGAVRIEEMLNYFTYDYARPTGGELFNVQAQVSQCPWNPDTQLLTLGFATPYETGAAEHGANLVFLIDVSGSMGDENKLGLLKDSFSVLLDHLDANDRVSIVTYSGQEEVVLEGAAGDDDRAILKAIYGLQAKGSTNGEAGLRMAYEIAQANYIDGGVNRIIMASDGDLNVGMTSESDLYDFVDKKRETGIYLSVLGFGAGNYKDNKMETIADHGNGSYHYIDCVDEAERVFSDKLMANLVPFADDVKMQVEFNPAQVKAYRLIGYENRELAAEDFLDDTVDAGDVGPDAQFTVAYEVVLADSPYEVDVPDLKYGTSDYAGGSGSSSSDWLTCSLRYRAFSDGEVHEQQLVVDASDATDNPSDDWKFASCVIEFGMLAGNSKYAGTTSIDGLLEQLGAMELSAERAGFATLVQKAAANIGE